MRRRKLGRLQRYYLLLTGHEMSWSKREAVTDLVILGDGEGCVKKVGGLLSGRALEKEYGITSGRQWVKLRRGLQRAVRAAERDRV